MDKSDKAMNDAEKQEIVTFLDRVIGKLNGNHPENGIDELIDYRNRIHFEIGTQARLAKAGLTR